MPKSSLVVSSFLTLVACRSHSQAARVSLPLGHWCVPSGVTLDTAFVVSQARDALSEQYLSAAGYQTTAFEPFSLHGIEQGILVSLVPRAVQLGGGGLVWVDAETGCATVLK